MSMMEINEASAFIYSVADPDATVIMGAGYDNELGDEIRITIIATGFEGKAAKPAFPGNPVTPGFPATNQGQASAPQRSSAPLFKAPTFDDIEVPSFMRKN